MIRKRHTGILLGMGLMGALATAPASAQTLISYFNFNGLTNAADPGNNPINADSGNGVITNNFEAANAINFTGTTVNAEFSDVAGRALAVQGGTSNVNNGRNITLQLDTTGWFDLNLSFATQRTATGFNSNQLSYSTDGVNFTDFAAAYNPETAFAVQAFDLSGVSAIENQENVFLRITFTGATTASGNNRIDNLKVTAVPGPSSLAVFALGGIAPAMALRRRRAMK